MKWIAITALALLGCGAPPTPSTPPPGAEPYPGALRPPSAHPENFMMRQRVTAHWGEHARGFDAVLQKQGTQLVLLGLTPMNTPAFTLKLTGERIEFDNRSGEALPFPPRYILLDVQRVHFPWLPGSPPTDGERAGDAHGERVEEVWRDGRLLERRFRRLDGQPPGLIRVRYTADAAELHNGWFGYRLVIETSERRALP